MFHMVSSRKTSVKVHLIWYKIYHTTTTIMMNLILLDQCPTLFLLEILEMKHVLLLIIIINTNSGTLKNSD